MTRSVGRVGALALCGVGIGESLPRWSGVVQEPEPRQEVFRYPTPPSLAQARSVDRRRRDQPSFSSGWTISPSAFFLPSTMPRSWCARSSKRTTGYLGCRPAVFDAGSRGTGYPNPGTPPRAGRGRPSNSWPALSQAWSFPGSRSHGARAFQQTPPLASRPLCRTHPPPRRAWLPPRGLDETGQVAWVDQLRHHFGQGKIGADLSFYLGDLRELVGDRGVAGHLQYQNFPWANAFVVE